MDARSFVCSICPPGQPGYVQTHAQDNFGRWLGTLWPGETSRSLNEILVEMNHAIRWEPKRLSAAMMAGMPTPKEMDG
jgi:hypothetical protein